MASISSPWYALSTPPKTYADSCILKPHQLLVLSQSNRWKELAGQCPKGGQAAGGSRNVLVWRGREGVMWWWQVQGAGVS